MYSHILKSKAAIWRSVCFLFIGTLLLPAAPPSDAAPKPEILRDPKTNVIYYLETDHCHLVAIDPDGKLLWNLKVLDAASKQRGFDIGGLGFWQKGNFPPMDETKPEDCLVLGGFVGTMLTIVVNKKTGTIAGEVGD